MEDTPVMIRVCAGGVDVFRRSGVTGDFNVLCDVVGVGSPLTSLTKSFIHMRFSGGILYQLEGSITFADCTP
jgi:hypothetical protein